MSGMAFGIGDEDIENVLSRHWARVANTGGKSFGDIAAELFPLIDAGAVEKAALDGGTELDEQVEAAYADIERQLVERGVLEAPR